VAARRVVVRLEIGKLPFQVTPIPEQHVIEEFSPRRSDQALHEWVRQRHVRDSLDFLDLQNPKVRCPPVRLEYWIVIGTEMSR